MGEKADKGDKIEVEFRGAKEEQDMDSSDQKNVDTKKTTEEVKEDEVNNSNTTETEGKSVEKLVSEYEEKIKQLDDRHLRLVAEFDNYKKRTLRQFSDITRQANENLITELLDVIDNFRRALDAANDKSDFKSLLTGTEMIYSSLYKILEKEGLEPIDAVGQPFNPDLHEAMLQVESDDYPDGVVAQELSKGYKLNGKVIRFSRVAVSKGPGESED